MSDEIQDKLKSLETARSDMQEQLANTASMLAAIEEKITELTARQQERMRADDRIDNKLIGDTAQNKSTKERAATKLTEQALKSSTDESRIRLINRDLTQEEIEVKPGEKYDRR